MANKRREYLAELMRVVAGETGGENGVRETAARNFGSMQLSRTLLMTNSLTGAASYAVTRMVLDRARGRGAFLVSQLGRISAMGNFWLFSYSYGRVKGGRYNNTATQDVSL